MVRMKQKITALYYDDVTYKKVDLPIVVSERGLVYVGSFDEAIADVMQRFNEKGAFEWHKDEMKLAPVRLQLTEYFNKQRNQFDLSFDWQFGTPFQQEVWTKLVGIPYGQTSSYGVIAKQIGRPQAVRAVGSAIGKNPLSIIVPCHRVLTSTGKLGGYSGGLSMKCELLEIEGVIDQSKSLAKDLKTSSIL